MSPRPRRSSSRTTRTSSLAAEQAAAAAAKPARVVPTDSMQAGLAAIVAFDPSAAAEENAEAMDEAAAASAPGR